MNTPTTDCRVLSAHTSGTYSNIGLNVVALANITRILYQCS